MNALLTVLSLALCVAVALFAPGGASAVLFCAALACLAGLALHRVEADKTFLLQIFVSGLLLRMLVGAVIHVFALHNFFGGDAITYDSLGYAVMQMWQGDKYYENFAREYVWEVGGSWGMPYLVAAIYTLVGRNPLAVQFFNAVAGAATAPLIYLCARHIFTNARVARIAAFFVAFFPSLVLWSSQGLKDGLIVFLLALTMLSTLKLGERLKAAHVAVLAGALIALLSLRFYIFFMAAAAIGGAFGVGMSRASAQNLARLFVIVIVVGLGMTYFGVLRTASSTLENFGRLEAIQQSRADLARSAQSGFGRDVDVSTTAGAISVIPVGMLYLLFAPFPWQLANLRQSITLPEMVVWWGSFPLLVTGAWFTLKFRLRQALPILLFTTMLTLGYSIFQGNVGTAYRQRSQLLVFYFIFVAVGFVLLRERQEYRDRQATLARQRLVEETQALEAKRRYDRWRSGREKELEEIARGLSERLDF